MFAFSLTSCYGANTEDIVVNEIMWMGTAASANDEWIELRNKTSSDIDLSGWTLSAEDGTPSINLSGVIVSNGYFLLERTDDTTISDISADQIYTGALENGGEHLFLKNNTGNVIDEVDASGGWPAGDNSLMASMEKQSGGWLTNNRITINGKDADGNPIKGTPRAANSDGESTTPTLNSTPTPIVSPTNAPSPTSVPIDTPTPTPQKAIYQINNVKDGDGNILASVKIYVDGAYIHHYAPEILEFCDECYCDQNKQISCHFGSHIIKLEKDGYQDWSEIKTINAGDSYEVNPLLSQLSPTSTLILTITSSLTPTVVPTEILSPSEKPTSIPTSVGEVLGATESAEASGSFQSFQNEKSKENKSQEAPSSSKSYLWPKVLIGLGLALIIGAFFPFWLPKLKMLYNGFHGKN